MLSLTPLGGTTINALLTQCYVCAWRAVHCVCIWSTGRESMSVIVELTGKNTSNETLLSLARLIEPS